MSAVKALQQWCRLQCDGYRDVSITNMTTSFRDGLAFCALIHKHRPDLIDFDSLRKENVYENNKLVFRVAEEQLGIPALLDAEDMVALRVPDRLSILTYVSQYYNYFHGRSPIGGMGGIKRPPDAAADEPPGKKNQPVSSKVFASSKPARENSPPRWAPAARPRQPSPAQTRRVAQEAPAEKSHQTGTLSSKCASCNKHVHLVQRHLVDGKLYHRNCARLLSPSSPLRDLPRNTSPAKFTPQPDLAKKAPPTSTTTTTSTTSRLGPSWLVEKPTASPASSSSASPSQPAFSLSKPASDTQTALASKSTAPRSSAATTTPTPTPTPATRSSTTAAKTVQAKLKFFMSDSAAAASDRKPATTTVDTNKGLKVAGQKQEATAVTVVVNVGRNASSDAGESSKAKAAAFISKKLAEESSSSSSSSAAAGGYKPTWANAAPKKTDTPAQAETPRRKEPEGVRKKVKLRADPSLLADLQPPAAGKPGATPGATPGAAVSTASVSIRPRTPDGGGSKPSGASPNATAAPDTEAPASWRSRLKPVAKETKPADPPQSAARPRNDGGAKSQTPDLPARQPASPHPPAPSVSVTPPAPKGLLNGQRDAGAGDNKTDTKISKMKPDFIPKDDILRELQEIEDNLNELEKRGVELEKKLREEEGEDDAVNNALMVEWFNLIRNKQVAMRRESELVYIGRTQDLEEQQPTVEQELRGLMEKPEYLKTAWDHKREEELMAKLVEIVNDRNAIVEGLDEDRLREEEEDEELNKMMMNFNIKKEKPKKKSPMSKLFGWGSKKEA